MKKRGFLLIYALFILTLLTTTGLLMLDRSRNNTLLSSYYADKLKAKYAAETDLYVFIDELVAEGYFQDTMKQIARRRSGDTIESSRDFSSLADGSLRRVLYRHTRDGRLEIELPSGQMGIDYRMRAELTLLNELFHPEDCKLEVKSENEELYTRFLEDGLVPAAITDVYIPAQDRSYSLEQRGSDLYLKEQLEPELENLETELPIDPEEDPVTEPLDPIATEPVPEIVEEILPKEVYLGPQLTYRGTQTIKLEGILQMDGQTVIEAPVELIGILVLDGKPQITTGRIKVTGGIVYRGEIPEKVTLIPLKSRVIKWGAMQEGFFDPKVKTIQFGR